MAVVDYSRIVHWKVYILDEIFHMILNSMHFMLTQP